MNNKVFILVFLTYISLAAASKAPFITKCKANDDKCHTESAQKVIPLFADGIPELNVEKHDPLILKYVDASTSNLKLIVTDIVVKGLKNCVAKKISRGDLKLVVKIQCAVDFKGKYDMNGQLFLLPIAGSGDLTAYVPSILIEVLADVKEKTGKDGKMHWAVKSWSHTFELKEKSDVKFENLFPDNELLRKTTEELIAKNGNDVIIEIGKEIIKALCGKAIEGINKFFLAVPYEDLTL
uniref:Odorant binding protein 6 n=1 Tax=Mythimna separata TaxID=271217 RepID=A0A1V1WC33_MYTSE